MSMLSQKNIEEVVLVFKKELLKTQDQNVDRSGSYRQLLVGALNTCAERFPTVTVTIVPVLLEFLGDKGALDVVLFVRRIIRCAWVLFVGVDPPAKDGVHCR